MEKRHKTQDPLFHFFSFLGAEKVESLLVAKTDSAC
jgi:hypothetical protein